MNLDYTGTVFPKCYDYKKSAYLELPQWIAQIRSDRFKTEVLTYRQLMAEGKNKEAQPFKKELMGFVCGAQCQGGRNAASVQGYSQVVMADYDCHDAAWSRAQGPKIQPIRWVLAYHVSPGNGLRVFCRLKVDDPDRFEEAINQLLAELDQVVGFEHDKHTTDRLRLSFASYDPDAWCRENWEESEPYPLQLEEKPKVKIIDKKQIAIQPSQTSQTMYDLSDEQLVAFLEKRLAHSAFVRGNRNTTLGFVGLQASDYHLSLSAVHRLGALMGQRCADEEYSAFYIEKEVVRAYHNGLRSSATSAFSSYGGTVVDQSAQNPPEEVDEGKVVREECPVFPEEVFLLLPEFFTQLLEPAKNERERDYLLGGCLTVASAMLPNVKIRMRENDFSPHLGLIITAPAGSGKGVALYPRLLAEPLNERFLKEAEAKKQQYLDAKQEWDDERRLAFIEKRKARKELDPGTMPDVPIFICPTRCSRSVFVRGLAASPTMLMTTAELGTSTESIKADCGHYSSDLRLALMNEVTEQAYLKDGKIISTSQPKIAFLASGTPDQLGSFLDSIDNGLMSRLFIYLGEGASEWLTLCGYSADSEMIPAWKQRYGEVGQQFIEIYDYLDAHPTLVRATEMQNAYMDVFFAQRLKLVKAIQKEDDNSSLVTRGCLLTHRICAVLAGIRKALNRLTDSFLYFTDEEVQLAIAMTQVYLQHELHAVTILPKKYGRKKKLHSTFTNAAIFDKLPDEFTAAEFLAACKEVRNIQKSVAYKLLHQWVEDGLIEVVKKGLYRKTGKSYLS